MALTKHFKKILKNSTFSIVSDPSHSYCMVEYYTGFGDSRNCETYYVLKSVLLPVLEQTKSVKTLLAVAIENRLLGSDDTRLTQIPPATTTDTKSESCVIADSVGVVDSVGDSLSHEFEQALSYCDTCLDLPSFMRCKDVCASLLSPSLSKDDPQVSPFIDDDIPDFGLGV